MGKESAKTLARTDALLDRVRAGGGDLRRSEQLELTLRLALPAMLSNLSHIIMEYIDSSMVGHLGASASASIGLVATTTWLPWGLGAAVVTGFAVQVAHRIGARTDAEARNVMRQSLVVALSAALLMAVVGVAVSGRLPYWLGGGEDIAPAASGYFFVYSLTLPLYELNYLMGAMLRASGNVKTPSLLNVMLCVFDVLFNMLMIFPTRTVSLLGLEFTLWGANLGVVGAAVGTALAEVAILLPMAIALFWRNRHLGIFGKMRRGAGENGSFRLTKTVLRRALTIGTPVAFERMLMTGAQICTTIIVAPLGMFAIAANAFAINAESLCYMPGYGMSDAASTLVGQSIGAQRVDLARRFAWSSVLMGIGIMTLMGAFMYVAAPLLMGILTPVGEIIDLGVSVLRIEAFAEPLYAASIVCYGSMVGAGHSLIPSTINLATIWCIRLPLAVLLAPVMGLRGVWLAMAIELSIRGLLQLWRLASQKWIPKHLREKNA